jgi:ferredoxin
LSEAPAAGWPVRLVGSDLSFDAPPDVSLLMAARAAGLRLASSCRNGTCRACIAQLESGEIVHSIEWPGLSREEMAEGWILPCVAQARSALLLRIAAAQTPSNHRADAGPG